MAALEIYIKHEKHLEINGRGVALLKPLAGLYSVVSLFVVAQMPNEDIIKTVPLQFYAST